MQASEDKKYEFQRKKIISLQQRIVDARARYEKALRTFGAEHGDTEVVIGAMRALRAAETDLEVEELQEVCERVKFASLFEQTENLPVM